MKSKISKKWECCLSSLLKSHSRRMALIVFALIIPEAPFRTDSSFPSTSTFSRSIEEMFSSLQNPSSLRTEILVGFFSLALTTCPHRSEPGLVRNASSSASPKAKLWHLMFFLLDKFFSISAKRYGEGSKA